MPKPTVMPKVENTTTLLSRLLESIEQDILPLTMHLLKRYHEWPEADRPAPDTLIFLSTHEPCSMCLSAIAWSGFENIRYLFTHQDDSRDAFAIPHDLRILKEVFDVDPGNYRRDNAFFEAASIRDAVSQLPDENRDALLSRADLIAARYAALSDAAGDDNTDQPVGVFVAWYADNSCRLRIGTSESVGVTSIDVDMDEAGARTLINCDIPTGQRLTLMTRGDGLTLGERQSLTQPAEIDSAVNSALAWVTRVGEVSERFVPDEIAARRFVVDGHVMIRSTPGVDTVDSAPHISKRAFADVIGSLEPLLKSPPEPPPPQHRLDSSPCVRGFGKFHESFALALIQLIFTDRARFTILTGNNAADGHGNPSVLVGKVCPLNTCIHERLHALADIPSSE